MFKELRRRLILICMTITGLILIGMSGTSLFLAQRQLNERGRAAFQSSVNSILYHIRSQNVIDHTWLSQMEASDGLIIDVRINGAKLTYSGPGDEKKRIELISLVRDIGFRKYGIDLSAKLNSKIKTEKEEFIFADAQKEQYYAAAVKIPLEKGWSSVSIIKSMREETQEMALQKGMFAAFTVFSLGLLFTFAWFFTGGAVRPLEKNHQRQLHFVSAASHELRSPLAVIRSSLSAMRGAPPEDAKRFAEAADSECQRMSRLIDDLLLLASADGGRWSVKMEAAEIETLVLLACEAFEQRAYQKKITILPILPDEPLPRCSCDSQRMMQVLSILLDNSITYTPSGGRITVSTKKYSKNLRITIADNGCGVTKEQKEHIFERFYRGDDSRSKREHYGLGLCIAKEIVTLHKGVITVEDNEGGGAVFSVILPRDHGEHYR